MRRKVNIFLLGLREIKEGIFVRQWSFCRKEKTIAWCFPGMLYIKLDNFSVFRLAFLEFVVYNGS